jgi:hypothetical protein
MANTDDLQKENAALRAALQRERELSATERRRAELWEEACRRSYRYALTARTARTGDARSEE